MAQTAKKQRSNIDTIYAKLYDFTMSSITWNSWVCYDESSPSKLRWIASPARRTPIGYVAGDLATGYWRVQVQGVRRLCHRIVWELLNGPIPDGMEIDHIDKDSTNNSIANLRLATSSQNSCNKRTRPDNTSGYKGVYYHKLSSKWAAQIKLKGKPKHLGLFDSPESAHVAYCKAAKELHKEFAYTGAV